MSASTSVTIGVVATIIVAVVVAYIQRRPKRLEYEVTVDRELASGLDRWGADVVIRVGDTVAKQPRILSFRLRNTGRLPIRREDFELPLDVSVAGRVLKHEAVGFHPSNLRHDVILGEDERTIRFKPFLMNPGDWIEIQAIIDGSAVPMELDARIAGVKTVRSRRDLVSKKLVSVVVLGWILAMLVSVGGLLILEENISWTYVSTLITPILVVSASAFGYYFAKSDGGTEE